MVRQYGFKFDPRCRTLTKKHIHESFHLRVRSGKSDCATEVAFKQPVNIHSPVERGVGHMQSSSGQRGYQPTLRVHFNDLVKAKARRFYTAWKTRSIS